MTNDQLAKMEVHVIRELMRERDAAQARVAELEAAARIDIDAANSECAARDCRAWISRGIVCSNCPCYSVSESALVLGIELASAQKLADAGKDVTP